MKTPTLGILTIGQSPRPDGLAQDVLAALGDAKVVERGALDGLSNAEIRSLEPQGDDYRLVTLLNDGAQVTLAKRHIVPHLQSQVDQLERLGVDTTLLLCTGELPHFQHSVPLITPQELLYSLAKNLAQGGLVGSVIPLKSQVEQAKEKWREFGVGDAFVAPANPYAADALLAVAAAAEKARAAGVAALLMDCFGYNSAMRSAACQAFSAPVVLARTMAARLAAAVAHEL